MFELSITNNHSSAFTESPENYYGFLSDIHEPIFYSNESFILKGLRFKNEKDDFFENDDFVVVIVGKVFYRMGVQSSVRNLTAEELLTQFSLHQDSFLDHLKGNFIIILYDKKAKQLSIYKDILGLKYLWYKWDSTHFYISTNLSIFKLITYKVNYSAIIEKLLFTYPIGEESYLEDVNILEGGGLLRYRNNNLEKLHTARIEDLFNNINQLKKFDIKTFLDIFENSVIQRSKVGSKINVSFTGGFDGRSNLAVLLKNKCDFHAYSFGKPGGENTSVPIKISEKLQLDYLPIFLGEEYENTYARCAQDAIHFSDGISVFERANYIFAMRKLVKHSQYNVTGLIGGEIFAPIHLKTDYINSTYFDLIYEEKEYSIENILVEKEIKKYIRSEILENADTLNKIKSNIEFRRERVKSWKNSEAGWMYYLKDLISLGFRHFYGNQMHLERYFNENLSPFYDLDVIKYLFSTDHIYKYKNSFKSSAFLRRNNRKLQTLIIDHFSKELSNLPVDRGYPPIYSTDLRRLLIPFIFYKRRLKHKHSVPEFDTPFWSTILYNELIKDPSLLNDELLIPGTIDSKLKNYSREQYNKSFNQLISISIWLNQ